MTHPYADLARRAIGAWLRGEPLPIGLPDGLEARASVFVSLHRPDGALRGCIGHLAPTRATLGEEIATTAVLAASDDPRFPPLRPEELSELDVEVSVLSAPEPVADAADLDASTFGVVVTSGRRRGVLLPDLEGVDTVAEQLAIARRKAGIDPREPVSLERFRVRKYR